MRLPLVGKTRVRLVNRAIVESDPRAFVNAGGNLRPVTEWTKEMAAAVASVEVVIKTAKPISPNNVLYPVGVSGVSRTRNAESLLERFSSELFDVGPRKNVPVKIAAKIVRHTNVNTTLKVNTAGA